MDIIDGKYKVLRTLGKGGGGTVYVCFDEVMNREVAVKILNDDIASFTNAKRFRAEAQALSLCKHPNVVPILHFGTTPDSHPYYVMEYIDGVSLASEIERNGPLVPKRFASICLDILSALCVAHRNGLVHRDIKPSNIMLSTTDGAKGKAILIDFGITKRLEGAQKLTATDSLLGTPFYMSPEQCKSGEVDARSDMYSFGCTMYEAATGTPPFTGDSMQVLMSHLQDEVQGIPAELAPFFARCLAKDPAQRFANATQALEAFKGLQISTLKRFTINQCGATAARSKIPRTVAPIAVAMLLPLAVGLLFFLYDAQQQQSSVPSETKYTNPMDVIHRFESAVQSKDLKTIEALKSDYIEIAPFNAYKNAHLVATLTYEDEAKNLDTALEVIPNENYFGPKPNFALRSIDLRKPMLLTKELAMRAGSVGSRSKKTIR